MLVGVRRGCATIVFAFSPTLFAETGAQRESDPLGEPVCETVCWSAPPGCPSEADVRARIIEQGVSLEASATGLPGLGLSARVSQSESAYELVLTRLGQTRVIRSAKCDALADVTAVVVVLSQRDNSNWQEVMAVTLPEGVADATPADAAVPSESPEPVSAEVASAGAPKGDAPKAQPEPPPKPEIVVESTAWPSPVVDVSEARKPWFSEPKVAVGGLLDPWLLPELGPGLRARGSLRMGEWLEVQLFGNWLPAVTSTIVGADVEVEYGYWAIGAQLCAAAPELRALAVCAGMELGTISAFGSELQDSQRRTVVSPIPALGAHWLPQLGAVFLDVGLEGIFPLRNDVFTVNVEGQPLHKIPVATARLVLLVGYNF